MNLKKLTKGEIKSLHGGLDYLVNFVLDSKWKTEDKENLYNIFEKIKKEVKNG